MDSRDITTKRIVGSIIVVLAPFVLVVSLLVAQAQGGGKPGCAVRSANSTLAKSATQDPPWSDLQAAIDAAAPGDTLVIKGICRGAFVIGNDLNLRGDDGATLDGDGGGTVVTVNGGNVALTNLTITDGGIGGVANFATLTLSRSTVKGNSSARSGAGIFNYGTVALRDSAVIDNESDFDGGGILNGDTEFSAGTVILDRSLVKGNKAAGSGGGIFNTTGTVSLTHSLVVRNFSAERGGGIFSRGVLSLLHSSVTGNSGTAGSNDISSSGQFDMTS
jgi:hypothetical protein